MRTEFHADRPSPPRGWRSLARICERGLFALGTCCLVVYLGACGHSAFFQSRERAAFEKALTAAIQRQSRDQSDWSQQRLESYEPMKKVPGNALGRLDIPDASISVVLLRGTDELTLNRAVGHIEGTALPGQTGNVGIAGHRDSFFRGLRHVEVGDELSLTTLEGVADYRITEIRIVDPGAVDVLAPTRHESVTLVTCYPFYFVGDAPKRYIVHARQVHFEPWSQRASRD